MKSLFAKTDNSVQMFKLRFIGMHNEKNMISEKSYLFLQINIYLIIYIQVHLNKL